MSKELYCYYQSASGNLYAIIRRNTDGYVWIQDSSAWGSWVNANIATYDVPLTALGGDFWAADWPSAMTSAANCRVFVYLRAGASPATTDSLLASYSLYWNGQAGGTSSTITLDTYALTSLDNLKTFLRITGSTYDTALTMSINQASAMIERVTGKLFLARNLTQRYNLNYQRNVTLRQTPVNSINRIAYGRALAMTWSYSGSAVTAAASCSDTGVRLTSTTGAGSTTNTDLAYADYPTLSLLSAAAPAGWSTTYVVDMNSKYLNPQGPVTAISNSVNMYYPDRVFTEYTVDFPRGIITISRYGNYWYQDNLDYPATFPNYLPKNQQRQMAQQPQGFLVEYNAGYATVPADVEECALFVSQRMYSEGMTNPAIQTTSMGPYSVTYGRGWLEEEIRRRLSVYCDAYATVG